MLARVLVSGSGTIAITLAFESTKPRLYCEQQTSTQANSCALLPIVTFQVFCGVCTPPATDCKKVLREASLFARVEGTILLYPGKHQGCQLDIL
jgi:hypothetical protein